MFQAAKGMREMHVLPESRTLKFKLVPVFKVRAMTLEANCKMTTCYVFTPEGRQREKAMPGVPLG